MNHTLTASPTDVLGCVVLKTPLFEDVRGFFCEAFKDKDYARVGLPAVWQQDNISGSKKGVLRGLHIQRKNPQGKLVRCTSGAIYDVCLDLRKDSPTFMKWHGEVLTGGKALYCPPGTAHGFLALEHNSVVYYKCTSLYDAESDGGVNPLKDKLIEWPKSDITYTLSEKDKKLPSVEEWLADTRSTWNG